LVQRRRVGRASHVKSHTVEVVLDLGSGILTEQKDQSSDKGSGQQSGNGGDDEGDSVVGSGTLSDKGSNSRAVHLERRIGRVGDVLPIDVTGVIAGQSEIEVLNVEVRW